jgi:serine/threonine protein kinase/tetratricopeptide (TPR) repeat protein
MIGTTVSHYRIVDRLGGGGMGVVYKAEDLKLRRSAALKFLPPEMTRDDSARARFVQEAQAASALDHPNICTIYEIDETPEGQSFIAMAYYDGETLKKKIERGPLSFADAMNLACQIAEGLSSAHARGIVHRDIKPANIMVTTEGKAKILDFGLAKLPEATALTQAGSTFGTASYMSPEQARGQPVDSRTDLWSLGVVLYEMIAGRRPFSGDSSQVVIYSILNNAAEPLSTTGSQLPPELSRIVSRTLAKHPSERYSSAEGLLDDLRRVQRGLDPRSSSMRAAAKVVPSLAVLPFSDMSPQRDQDYFCEGIAEELINALASLEGVRVASRTSSFQFKGQAQDIRRIGEQLSVDSILEGSVRKAGNRARITVQLIDCRNGYHLWSERYDRDLDDIFAVQDEITRAIVEKLKIRLIVEPDAPLVKHGTASLEAYNLYLQGRYYWVRRYEGFLQKAIECFEQATQKDPAYALAYAGLADGYTLLGIYGVEPPQQAAAKARPAAERAVALDDALPEAHRALGFILFNLEWNWADGERECRRAIELDPNGGLSVGLLGVELAFLGRFDEGIPLVARARALEPVSALIAYYNALVLHLARRHQEALAESDRGLVLDPHFALALYTRTQALLGLGRAQEAVVPAESAVALTNRPLLMANLGSAYAAAGRREEARRILAEVEDQARSAYVDPTFPALIHASLGDAESAIEDLNAGCRARSVWTLTALHNLPFDFLRGNPQFEDVRRRILAGGG